MTTPATPPRAGDVETHAREAALVALYDGSGPAAAARAAIAVADRVMEQLRTIPEAAEALAGAACKEGCGWCCHQVVGITSAEEALLADTIQAMKPKLRAGIAARLKAAQQRLEGVPVEEWQAARVPCPLLEDGRCVAHAGRPIPCRAVLSVDAGACRRWQAGEDGARIPVIAVQRRVYSLAQAGLAQALAEAGTPPAPVSLIEALGLALAE